MRVLWYKMDSYCWINGLITGLVGSIAIIVAIISILSNRKNTKTSKDEQRTLTRQQLTCQIVLDIHQNTKLLSNLAFMRKHHDQHANGLSELAKKNLSEEQSLQSKQVLELLSFFEAVAVGVKHGIYDKDILKDNLETTINHIWDISSGFIERQRKDDNNSKYYEHLEALISDMK